MFNANLIPSDADILDAQADLWEERQAELEAESNPWSVEFYGWDHSPEEWWDLAEFSS